MEDNDYVPVEAKNFYGSYSSSRALSPEIVEIEEEKESRSSRVTAGSTSGDHIVVNDVYVAVGKDDTDVLKWTLDNAVCSGTRIFLVHVFPPITHIPTPVGKLAKSQLTEDQVRSYINEESNKRRNLLQKYVNLCNNAKVTVDTMLLESTGTAKAILDLIPVLSITHLVIGTKKSPHSRRARKKLPLGEFVRKNAPEFCEVSIVHEGKKVEVNDQRVNSPTMPENTRHSERSFFACCPDSAQEDQDFLTSSIRSGDKDETNSAIHYGKGEGHRLKCMTEMKWETRNPVS